MSQEKNNELSGRKIKNVRRKGVNIASTDMVKAEFLSHSETLPLVLTPNIKDLDLVEWARNHFGFIEEKLFLHGALLFRDFSLDAEVVFERFAATVSPELVNYVEGSSPRTMVGEKVYTSTEYPSEYFVSMHNELSYAHKWPGKLLFFCKQPATQGGETPLVDSRRLFALLNSKIKEKFIRKGVKYIRNLHGDYGAGLSWQTVFETSDKSVVEAYCREGGIDLCWTDDGGLSTNQVRPSAIVHPSTKEPVWFNQVDQWHPSNLGKSLAEALVFTANEDKLPINAYYGDGSPLEASVLEEIRALYQQIMIVFSWHKGDILLVDNMLVAHGRMPFIGARKVLVAMGSTVNSRNVVEV